MIVDSPSAPSQTPSFVQVCVKGVLENQDLLLRIFEEFTLEPYDEQMTRSSRAHLFRAAMTCKAFVDPALNVLWKSIDTFVPLFKLLPAFQLIQDEYVIRGAISQAHWERFYHYARKVREFAYPTFQDDNRVACHAKVRLSQLWRAPFLPNLRRYTCDDVRSLGPFIHSLFISSTTEYVKLGFITDPQDAAIGSLLSILVDEVPSLRTLVLSGTLSTSSVAYVLQFKNLRSLELQGMGESIDSHVFTLIAAFDKLAELTLDLYNSPSSIFFAGNGFKNLKKLHLTAFFYIIEQILVGLSGEVDLESLGFIAPPAPLPLGWESQCTSLFNTVHQRWPQSLRRITIDRDWSNLLCLPLSLTLISPLLRLRNMEYFSVRDFYLFLTSEEIRDLAAAWPSLQELHLPFDDRVTPQISFSMLYVLAELCPELSHLEIPLDTKNIPPIPTQRTPILLEQLYIANDNPPTETSDLLLMARHFDRLFPQLKRLGRLAGVKDLDITTWERVFAMIQAFRSVRLESSV